MTMRRILLSSLVSVSVLAAAAPAWGIDFDPGGELRFDPEAVVSESFDEFTAEGATKGTLEPLEGSGYVVIEQSGYAGDVTLSLKDRLPAGKHAFRGRLFARTNRIFASLAVSYPEETGLPDAFSWMFPTGRVTSDGWYEMESAPMSVDVDRAADVSLGMYASSADVDAFELVEAGTFREPVACTFPDDPACAEDQLCVARFCRDGDGLVPPLPKTARDRDDLLRTFEERLHGFFGGRYTVAERRPVALATLKSARSAKSAWAFWNGIMLSIRQLHDWHTKSSGPAAPYSFTGRGAFPVCVVEGDADLSHDLWPKDAKYPDVLVSHTGPTDNLGLKPGDRIVAVNGVHPFAFVQDLERVNWASWRACDPSVSAEAAEYLRVFIRRWATTVTIIRCDGETKVCSPPETIHTADLPDTNPDYPTCDHRPGYHLSAGKNPDAATHEIYDTFYGPLADSQPGEDLYGMVWNDVYWDGKSANPYQPAMDTFRKSAKGLVLDHRTGNGGTGIAAEYLTKLFRLPEEEPIAAFSGTVGTYDWFAPPFTTEEGKAIYQAHKGNYDEGFQIGDAKARTELRTALLLARDGSASDWLAYGMKGAPNVRIFGRPTAGAFSTFLQFDYFGEMSWQFATGDLVRKDGTTHLGEGVLPDEEVVPLQSDLLAGKDTAYERALAWIREGGAK
jgi:hypothetical protein